MNPSDLTDPANPTTVLVVDDSVSVRKALERILAPQGFAVRMADSAEAALESLEPMPDMILADILMPGMSGLELARILGDRGISAPIMLMSGIVDEVTQRDAQGAGACGVLRKPFTPAELLPAIEPHLRAALAARAPAAPAAAEPPATSVQTGTDGGLLDSLGRLGGVLGATLYGEGGQVSAQTGAALPEAFAMYARFLVTAANVGGTHVGQGDLRHIMLTYARQPVLLTASGNGQLAVVLEQAGAAAAVEGWLASRHN
ncbi:response regulator [Deinococcus sp. HMF7620]|uniref:Response regulator n=1 Tax=Deinococcus arboris TaxID=2682977 RepID=A0A7C9I1Y9_9DEIO|nr:response regulator [Deinococcus arboris]MVN89055.1 response regulator [Deinococcus arboris]